MTNSLTVLKNLEKVLKDVRYVYILIYGNPDPDALASGWALKEVLQSYGVSSSIGYTGEVGRFQNSTLITLLKLPASPVQKDLIEKADLIAVVDAQPDFFKDYPLPRVDIVIDHHPVKSPVTASFTDIRPHCIATSVILTEYLLACNRPIHKRLATALYHGIRTDSQGQQKRLSKTDLSIMTYLESRVDMSLLRRIEFSQYSLYDLDYFHIALVKHRFVRNVLYAHIGPVPYTDVCVQIADFFIRVRESHWALVTGVEGNKLVIIFRCDGYKKNAGRVARFAFESFGSAGGHKTMGRAEISKEKLPPDVQLTQNESIEWFVVNTLAKIDASFKPLLRVIKAEGVESRFAG